MASETRTETAALPDQAGSPYLLAPDVPGAACASDEPPADDDTAGFLMLDYERLPVVTGVHTSTKPVRAS